MKKRVLVLLAVLLVVAGVGLWVHAQVSTHFAALTWTQSTTPGITGNNVWRSQVQGGPYTKVTQSTTPITAYKDATVVGGQTYFYVVTAICATCNPNESNKSPEFKAVIPPDANPQPLPPSNLTGTVQ